MTKVINFTEGLEKLSYSTLIANYNTNTSCKEELDKRIEPFIKKKSQRKNRKILKIAKR